MAELTADIPSSLRTALDSEVARIKGTRSSVITAALADYLGTPVHTLFQISTSGALVAGVDSGVVRVQASWSMAISASAPSPTSMARWS